MHTDLKCRLSICNIVKKIQVPKNTVKNTGLWKVSDIFNTFSTTRIIFKRNLICFSTQILWQNKSKK